MTNANERHTLITPVGYQNMRGLFAEQAESHDAKIARAEGLIEKLDDDERSITHAERQLCIEALGLLIRDSRVSAEMLRDGVEAIDQQSATRQEATAADTTSTRDDDPDEDEGDDYGHAGTEYDHDNQDLGDVLGVYDDLPEF